ncbi:unnamed protein product [Mytilus edulis]|uniref:Nuclease HARBI1 n=1 Tax=Mytilus edulis TaxID=6550 RepID=A0A8S3UPX1_MYTED|nr:unnamed protein product [Mytilus edulis]
MALRLIYNVGRRHEKERVYRHMEPEYDDKEFKDRFRFSKNSLQFITDLIEPNLCRPTLRSHAIPAFTQVQLALRYFVSGSPMRVIGDTMGYHISSVSRAVRDVSSALCNVKYLSKEDICQPETSHQQRHLSNKDICPTKTSVNQRHLTNKDTCPTKTYVQQRHLSTRDI